MQHEKPIPEQLVIRNLGLNISDFIYPVLAVIAIGFIYNSEGIKSLFVWLFVAILLYNGWNIYKRLRNRSDKLVIDKEGICFCEDNLFYPWNDVKYAYIRKVKEGSGKETRFVDYFHVDTDEFETELCMDTLDYDADQIVRVVEYLSGRDIGELQDKVNDETRDLLGNALDVDDVAEAMKSFFKRQKLYGYLFLFIPMGTACYFQFAWQLHYSLAVGMTVMVMAMLLTERVMMTALRNHPMLCRLDDDKFQEMLGSYAEMYNEDVRKSKLRNDRIIVIVFAVAA